MRRWPAFLFAMLLLPFLGRPASAAEGPRLVILAVDRLTLGDLLGDHGPNLRRLVAEGASGLMTTRSIGGLSPEKIYLSIGAGEAQTSPPKLGGLAFDAGEVHLGLPAGEAYRLQTGKDPGAAQVLHLGLAGLADANAGAMLPNQMGRLGEALRSRGLRPAVLGNADAGEEYGREAVMLLMDREGRVALGHVGRDTLRPDPKVPGGWRTDYTALRRDYARLAGRANVVLVVLGDFARIHAESPALTPKMLAYHLSSALRRLDGFLGFVMNGPERPQGIILFAASPPLARMLQGERLVPVVLWGDGVKPGLLYSQTTRRTGVLTPYDLTATIAARCGLDPAPLTTGRALATRPGEASALPGFYAESLRNFQAREPLFQIYGYALLASALASLGLALRDPRPLPAARAASAALLGLAVVPAILLFLAPLPLGSLWVTIPAVLLAGLACGWLLARIWPRTRTRLMAAGLFVALAILGDVLFGSRLLARSLLGYSPFYGARFYGLGNEYLGVTLGAVILAGSTFAERPSRWASAVPIALFALTTAVIALPSWGANVGGGITAAVGLGYTYCRLRGRRLDWREGLGLLFNAAGLLAFLILYDLSLAGHGISHLGQTVLRLRAEGFGAFLAIARGKLLMSLRLLTYTAWSWVLLTLLFALPVALAYPPRRLARYLPRDHCLSAAIRGMWAAATVGLLVNDSGVVVAATIMIYLGVALVHLVLEGREVEGREATVT